VTDSDRLPGLGIVQFMLIKPLSIKFNMAKAINYKRVFSIMFVVKPFRAVVVGKL